MARNRVSTTAATQTALHRDAARRSTFYKPSGQPGAPRLAARGLRAAFHGVTETKAQALGGIGIHGAWDHDESGVHGTGPALHRTSRLVLLIAFFFFLFSFILSSTDISSVLVRYASRWAKRPPYFLSTLVSSSATCFDTASVAPRRGQRMIQTEKAPELIVRAPAIVS